MDVRFEKTKRTQKSSNYDEIYPQSRHSKRQLLVQAVVTTGGTDADTRPKTATIMPEIF